MGTVMMNPDAPAFARFAALGSEIAVGVTEQACLPLVEAPVRGCVGAIDQALSRFRPDSELRRLERQPGRRWDVSALFPEELALACQATASREGWFDPTARDAVEAAGYDRSSECLEREGAGPARHSAPAGQWAAIRFDRQTNVVVLPVGVRLDSGGIGKGLTVDDALRTLPPDAGGVRVNAGGDLAVAGAPPPEGWACAITVERGTPDTVVALHRGTLATSGLGRRQWTRDGERLHHLIDSHTGRPGESYCAA